MLPELEAAPSCQPQATLHPSTLSNILPPSVAHASSPGAVAVPWEPVPLPARSCACENAGLCLPLCSLHRIGAQLTLLEKLESELDRGKLGLRSPSVRPLSVCSSFRGLQEPHFGRRGEDGVKEAVRVSCQTLYFIQIEKKT